MMIPSVVRNDRILLARSAPRAPASGPANRSFNGLHPKSKFLAVCVFLLVESLQKETRFAWWIFAVVAVVYNPIAPIRLPRDTWEVINWVTAGLFVVALGMGWNENKPKLEDKA